MDWGNVHSSQTSTNQLQKRGEGKQKSSGDVDDIQYWLEWCLGEIEFFLAEMKESHDLFVNNARLQNDEGRCRGEKEVRRRFVAAG